MPPASQTFQQIADPQSEGPFSQYLRPVQRPIDEPQSPSTGWESAPVAAGEVVLGFLKGVRQNKLAQAQEEDRNTETGLNNFRAYTNARLQDPDLTDEARQRILSEANTIMNEHTHYAMRDVKKGGVAGFFKNLIEQSTGGPIKVRDPINWDEATGRIARITDPAINPQNSQGANYKQAVKAGQAALEDLKRTVPNPNAAQVRQALAGAYQIIESGAPSKANAFWTTFGVMPGAAYPEQGSLPDILQQTTPKARVAPTAPPPGVPPSVVSGAPPAQNGVVRPADTQPAFDSAGNMNPIPYVNAPGPTAAPPTAATQTATLQIGHVVTLKNGTKGTIKAVNPDGSLEIE